jgi:HEAT repeat protein
MKRIITIVGALVLLAGSTAMAAGWDHPSGLTEAQYNAAVTNLLIGLASDNTGLKTSSAFMLGELKATEAVVPLMAILRSEEKPCCRVVAALALCRIGEARGVFAVKQAIRFDDNEEVQQKCAWFYEQFVQPGSYQFIAGSANVAAR